MLVFPGRFDAGILGTWSVKSLGWQQSAWSWVPSESYVHMCSLVAWVCWCYWKIGTSGDNPAPTSAGDSQCGLCWENTPAGSPGPTGANEPSGEKHGFAEVH